jgi:hypothetical protein
MIADIIEVFIEKNVLSTNPKLRLKIIYDLLNDLKSNSNFTSKEKTQITNIVLKIASKHLSLHDQNTLGSTAKSGYPCPPSIGC